MGANGEWIPKGRWNGTNWLWMDQLLGYPKSLTGRISSRRFGDGTPLLAFEKTVAGDVFSGTFHDQSGGSFSFQNSSLEHLAPFRVAAQARLSRPASRYT